MAAAQMAVSATGLAARPAARPFQPRRAPARAAPLRAARVAAAKGNGEEAPNHVVSRAFGALLAAQLAVSGAAIADVLPDSATSGSARAEVNNATSALPSFKDIGKNLQDTLGFNSPKDIGAEISKNTPDVSPTELKGAAGKISDKVQNALPDTSENPLQNPLDKLAKQFDSNTPNTGDAKQAANDAQSKVQSLGKDVGANVPTADNVKDAAKGLGNKIQNATPDLSENILEKLAGKLDSNTPDLGDAKSVAGDAADKAKSLPDSLPSSGPSVSAPVPDLPRPDEAFKKAADGLSTKPL